MRACIFYLVKNDQYDNHCMIAYIVWRMFGSMVRSEDSTLNNKFVYMMLFMELGIGFGFEIMVGDFDMEFDMKFGLVILMWSLI